LISNLAILFLGSDKSVSLFSLN